MKKRTILLLSVMIFVFVQVSLFGFDFSWGMTVGLNVAKFGGKDAELPGVGKMDYKLGGAGGLFVSVSPIKILAIQPAVLFNIKGAAEKVEGLSGAKFDDLYSIEFPFLFKIYPFPEAKKVKVNAIFGPYVGVNVISRYRTTDDIMVAYMLLGAETEGDLQYVKNVDYGVNLGIGCDIDKTLLELTYSLGLTTVDESPFKQDLKNRVVSLMLGYTF
jgi:hypothetical protein